MAQDLSSFLELVRNQSSEDVINVSREMDPSFEITATVVKAEREAERRPVFLFDNVKGTKFPVLTNLPAYSRPSPGLISRTPGLGAGAQIGAQ